ncbi:MAG: VOC family protein [Planctomycetota bacterium]|jgi:catechol 2,3-dioxygenase-like lactoylglutathione lyase family enzyme
MMETQITGMVDAFETGRLSRRQLIAKLTGLTAALAAAPKAVLGQETSPGEAGSTFTGTDLNHIALSVTDVNRSRDFYMKHLGLELASQSQWNCFLRCRDHNFLALFRSEKPAMNHYCFSVKSYDAGEAVEKLKSVGLKPRRAENRVYFDDPDGLEVQVAAKEHGV